LEVSWDRDDCVSIIVIVGPPLALGSILIRFNKVPVFADFLTLSSLILAFSMIAVDILGHLADGLCISGAWSFFAADR